MGRITTRCFSPSSMSSNGFRGSNRGSVPVLRVSVNACKILLAEAIAAAEQAGLIWQKERVTLKPSAELVKLVRLSQEQAVKQGTEED